MNIGIGEIVLARKTAGVLQWNRCRGLLISIELYEHLLLEASSPFCDIGWEVADWQVP
jgi:hypothetical protein